MDFGVKCVNIAFYATSSVIGTIGNILTLLVLLKEKPVTNMSRYYLINLCILDLLMCATVLYPVYHPRKA